MKKQDEILKLRAEGLSYKDIKIILKCSLATISKYCGNKNETNFVRYDYNEDTLRKLVSESRSFNQVILKLGLKSNASRYDTLKRKFKEFNIDYSHFEGQAWNGVRHESESDEFITKVLILNGLKWTSHSIKLKLYKLGLKEEKCEECGLDKWLNKPISLHLDHINGNNKDNRLENLRILCPNCHSQTSTYAGKKRCKEAKMP